MTLKLNGSSSGSVSIDAPASTTSGADITFNLPVADGTSGQVLSTDASGQLAFASIVGGKVLQHVIANSSQTVTATSNTALLNVSIQPSATSSKILLFGYMQVWINASSNAFGAGRLYRGAITDTLLVRNYGGYDGSASFAWNCNMFYLDSPSTTSATTYTMSIDKNSANTASAGTDGQPHYLLAMEIASP